MSNLIKYPFVSFSKEDAVVIHHDGEKEDIKQETGEHKTLIRSLEEVEKERALYQQAKELKELSEESDSFEAGMPVVNMDEQWKQKEEDANRLSQQIISEARSQAMSILQQAEQQRDAIITAATEEGMRLGHEQGIAKANEELQQQRQKLEEIGRQKEKEYEDLIAEVEPRYVDVLCGLIQKITGVMVTDKRDVFLHLIRSGIADMDPARHYTIRVPEEDLAYVENHKDDILFRIGTDASIDVQEEKGLEKGDCINETDNQMIDCGFRTQITNLVTTLKLLV